MNYDPLFDLLNNQFGALPLESEMDDIIYCVQEMIKKDAEDCNQNNE